MKKIEIQSFPFISPILQIEYIKHACFKNAKIKSNINFWKFMIEMNENQGETNEEQNE